MRNVLLHVSRVCERVKIERETETKEMVREWMSNMLLRMCERERSSCERENVVGEKVNE